MLNYNDIYFQLGEIICYLLSYNKCDYGIFINSYDNDFINKIIIINEYGNTINNYDKKIINTYFDTKKLNNYKRLDNYKIFIGYDTNFECSEIKFRIMDGIFYINQEIKIIDLEYVTKSQLCYFIKYNYFTIDYYFNKFNFKNIDLNFDNLLVDCCNGIIYMSLMNIKNINNININLINTNIINDELLNNNCGLSYILQKNFFPKNFDKKKITCSFDNLNKKTIFYYYKDDEIYILDGHYIIALYLKTILNEITKNKNEIYIGFIYTIYINNGLLNWIKSTFKHYKNIKFLLTTEQDFKKNISNYDISIYFYACGYGNIKINKIELLQYDFFKYFDSFNNDITLDSISHLFCVLLCLKYLKIDYYNWYNLLRLNYCLFYPLTV